MSSQTKEDIKNITNLLDIENKSLLELNKLKINLTEAVKKISPRWKKFTKSNIDHLFEKLGHKTDTKDIFESGEQPQSFSSQNEIEMDFHSSKLFQVKDWLFGEMLGYIRSGYTTFVLIHGHNRGVVICNYLRNDFQREFGKNILY